MKTEPLSGYYELFRDAQGEVAATYHGSDSEHVEQHFHYCLEFLYVLEDKIFATVSGEDLTVHKGQVLLISCCEPHRIQFPPNQRHCILMLPHRYFADYSSVMAKKSFASRCLSDDENGSLLSMFRLFHDISNRKAGFSNLSTEAADNALIGLASAFLETVIGKVGLIDRHEVSIRSVDVAEYLYSHFREPVTVPLLAKTFFCNQQELSESFRRTFGEPPVSFLNRLRAEEVRTILRKEPNITLKEAAEKSGFRNVQKLLRAFRTYYNDTPKSFRSK